MRILRIREAMKAYEDGYLDKVSQTSFYAMQRIEARVQGE